MQGAMIMPVVILREENYEKMGPFIGRTFIGSRYLRMSLIHCLIAKYFCENSDRHWSVNQKILAPFYTHMHGHISTHPSPLAAAEFSHTHTHTSQLTTLKNDQKLGKQILLKSGFGQAGLLCMMIPSKRCLEA